ncbi:MAG: aromatic acid exporter family protein [Tissierellia bacterium]|nr:aromatic acid exporter family protein [Tissierellia bacterium]
MAKNQLPIEVLNYFRKILGVRTLKTAIATSLAIYVGHELNLATPLLAGISAVVSMTSSVFDSYTVSINRMLSTIVGALIASFFHYIGFVGFIPIGIGIVVIINLCIILKWQKAVTLACIVFIIIMLYREGVTDTVPHWQYGLNRTLDTSVGLLVGFLVNYLILPPNRGVFLVKTYQKSLSEFKGALRDILTGKKSIHIERLIDDINAINVELQSIRNDKKLGAEHNFKVSHITQINTQFFSVFSRIQQLSESNVVPFINEENKGEIFELFHENLPIPEETTRPDVEKSYNYSLRELLSMLIVLREFIEDFEETLVNA